MNSAKRYLRSIWLESQGRRYGELARAKGNTRQAYRAAKLEVAAYVRANDEAPFAVESYNPLN